MIKSEKLRLIAGNLFPKFVRSHYNHFYAHINTDGGDMNVKAADICQVCHKKKSMDELLPANLVRESIQQFIKREINDWDDKKYICIPCLNVYRAKYMKSIMEKDLGELDNLEKEVVQSFRNNDILAENINETYEESLGFGDRVSDRIASFGGSWAFHLGANKK